MRPVTVVIPTWNGLEYLQGLFSSLCDVEFNEGDRIIVVDNGSDDGSRGWLSALQECSPDLVEVISLSTNQGFSRAVNRGLSKAAEGSDVVILNNDCEIVDPEVFQRLQEQAYQVMNLGILSPVIVDPNGLIQAHGAVHLPFSHLGKTLCAGEGMVGQYAGQRFCEVVPFVCAYVKRACLDDVGLLDESFFAYFEDSDFCLRAGEAGWCVGSTSATVIVHLGPESTAGKVAARGVLYEESYRVFEQKWGNVLDQRYDLPCVWVGELAPQSGYGYWSRHAMRAALDAGVLTYYQPARMSPDMDRASPDLVTRDCQAHMGEPTMPQILIEHASRFSRNSGSYRIGWTMSDVDPWPEVWQKGCSWVDEVWVPTQCDKERLKRARVKKRVEVVPLGVDPGRFHPQISPWGGRPDCDFLFVSNFQWGVRKNPDLLIRAFRDEFSKDEDVGLFIKTNPARTDEVLQYETRWWTRDSASPVWVFPDPVPDWQLGGIYTLGDCFVLPTSGEGWCLPAMEALACGVPVIITGWGPPAEWGTGQDGEPLPGMHFLDFKVIECRSDIRLYSRSSWAQPNYEHLRFLMREAYENREEWKGSGLLGGAWIRRSYTWERVGRRIRERLEEVQEEPF